MTKIRVTKEKKLDSGPMQTTVRMVFHEPVTLREGDALVFNVHDEFVHLTLRPEDYCEECHGTGSVAEETEDIMTPQMVACPAEVHKIKEDHV